MSPAGYLYLDDIEQKNLALFIKSCELNKSNLKSTETALSKCMKSEYIAPAWFQTASVFIMIAGATLVTGYYIGSKR